MQRALAEVVDVMRVPATGNPARAVRVVPAHAGAQDVACDVLVAGGGTGGVAAALAAARGGRRVVLLEETDWLGGQLTAQGISALDEHPHIETFGGTRSYLRLRELLREHYRSRYRTRDGIPPPAPGRPGADFNPGNCWVSGLAFEPRAAVAAIDTLLLPLIESGRLTVRRRTRVVAADVHGERIAAVVAMHLDDDLLTRFHPELVIDATELGDLLPLCGAEHVVGAETIAQTGEPQAQPDQAKPHCVQSFTYPFACERRAVGEDHRIDRPERYAHYRAAQPYSLRIEVHGGEIYGETSGWLDYRLYDTMPGTKGGLWTYRRLLDAVAFDDSVRHDLTLFNWPGNDYRDRSLLSGSAQSVAQALQEAKRVSLGFLHWLQTEAPATGDRLGAPEIRLRPDVMDTADGLAKYPYIRESRRILARRTIVEQDVSVHHQPGPRAAPFDDSVGVGWYPIDIHRSGQDDTGASCRTRPFQIPLGALLPRRLANLIAGGKNIGTTHITNGCYRLHPIEWNIGEAAGSLAAYALETGSTLASVHDRPDLRERLQRRLLADGVPLAWLVDVGPADPLFVGSQLLQLDGGLDERADLLFAPTAPLSRDEWLRSIGPDRPDDAADLPATRAAAALRRMRRPVG